GGRAHRDAERVVQARDARDEVRWVDTALGDKASEAPAHLFVGGPNRQYVIRVVHAFEERREIAGRVGVGDPRPSPVGHRRLHASYAKCPRGATPTWNPAEDPSSSPVGSTPSRLQYPVSG